MLVTRTGPHITNIGDNSLYKMFQRISIDSSTPIMNRLFLSKDGYLYYETRKADMVLPKQVKKENGNLVSNKQKKPCETLQILVRHPDAMQTSSSLPTESACWALRCEGQCRLRQVRRLRCWYYLEKHIAAVDEYPSKRSSTAKLQVIDQIDPQGWS